ncbi:MAG: hypothetical protein EXR55_03000 [Dehalococcoidia bacterium]|nr:hypothetical protein [Dehalococcoidia bacterium]
MDPRTPRYGGTYVQGQENDPPSIDPYHTMATTMANSAGVVYERLIHGASDAGTDPTLDIRVPALAESWDIAEDFLTYTIHLRKGVKWHNIPPVNGRKLDAEDVQVTSDLLSGSGGVQKGFFAASVDRVEVVLHEAGDPRVHRLHCRIRPRVHPSQGDYRLHRHLQPKGQRHLHRAFHGGGGLRVQGGHQLPLEPRLLAVRRGGQPAPLPGRAQGHNHP